MGGQIFAEIFERPFFTCFQKKFQHFPPNLCHLSPKISDDLFLVIDHFSCFNVIFFRRGAKSVAHIETGAKILTFPQIHNAIVTLSAPEGGQTPLPTSMGGHGRICPLWIRHWLCALLTVVNRLTTSFGALCSKSSLRGWQRATAKTRAMKLSFRWVAC